LAWSSADGNLAFGGLEGTDIWGIIMFKELRLAAVASVAGAIFALMTTSVWAFSQQMLTPNGNYNFNYGPLDDKAKSGDSTTKSDSNSPGFHFSVEGSQTGSSGFHNFGDDSSEKTWDRFSRPIGNGN
jgi:hypothetical protein